MSAAGIVFGAGVLAALAGIAAIDARRMTISPAWLAGLVVAGTGWLLAGGGLETVGAGWERHAMGLAAGLGAVFVFILGAELLGRRWPIYPGDGFLLGAVGGMVGMRGLFQAMALGAALALVHRACVQRKRGRPFGAGYLPAGPGLAAGAAAVFVALNAGFALADKHKAPGADAAGDPLRIVATELPPVKPPLPAELADREVTLDIAVPVPFADLVARIGEAAGIPVAIEERPSRIADGRAALAEPPPMLPGSETRLGALLDDVAARADYGWEWKDERIVFYRYRDAAWIAERPGSGPYRTSPEIHVSKPPRDPLKGLFAWIGRLFGGEGGEEKAGDPAPGIEPAERAAADPPAPQDAPADEPAETASAAGEGGASGAGTGSAAGTAKAEASAPAPAAGEAGETAEAAPPEPEPPVWRVVPEDQKTLRGVLEAWAEQAEWKVAWRAEKDFSVGAPATFEGGFLEAVDSLLSDPGISRVLTARAHANRYLVIEGTRP